MGRIRVAAVAFAFLLLAGCGGTTTRQASIPPATANHLASESDALAAALQRGDSCGGASHAQALRRQVASAISSGSIPRSLAAPARLASSRLVSEIACTRPHAPAPASPAPASLTCEGADARKHVLEGEKHGPAKHGNGRSDAARKHELDQEEHALDELRKGCE
jgi:outer membrane murein-binding lipoprotein Lpp